MPAGQILNSPGHDQRLGYGAQRREPEFLAPVEDGPRGELDLDLVSRHDRLCPRRDLLREERPQAGDELRAGDAGEAWIAVTACSRLEPVPKLKAPTTTSPDRARPGKPGS